MLTSAVQPAGEVYLRESRVREAYG